VGGGKKPGALPSPGGATAGAAGGAAVGGCGDGAADVTVCVAVTNCVVGDGKPAGRVPVIVNVGVMPGVPIGD
jgi:hypothetical protein